MLLRSVLLLVATEREFGPGCLCWRCESWGLMKLFRKASSHPRWGFTDLGNKWVKLFWKPRDPWFREAVDFLGIRIKWSVCSWPLQINQLAARRLRGQQAFWLEEGLLFVPSAWKQGWGGKFNLTIRPKRIHIRHSHGKLGDQVLLLMEQFVFSVSALCS